MDAKLTGKIIAEKRKEKGLNQIQLGELLNVSNRTISKWENGDGYPDITLLPDIARCLDISIDRLLTGEEQALPEVSNKEKRKKALNDFKLCFLVSLFFAISGALLGGITEAYCIWAFPILFFTHWEIMFCAVSLFAVIASVFVFMGGLLRLQAEYDRKYIIDLAIKKALALLILLAIFPLSFIVRVITIPLSLLIALIIAVVIIIISAVSVISFVNKLEKNN